MPILLLHRTLKITNKEEEDFYVIVEDSQIGKEKEWYIPNQINNITICHSFYV